MSNREIMGEMPGGEFKRGTVAAGGYILDYAAAGAPDGKVIVSLPGSAGMQMSHAKDMLARKHRIIELNPPGWGGKTDLNRAMSQQEIGGVLAEAAKKLVGGSYFVIGASMGGTNALWLASFAHGQVKGIVLEGSMAPSVQEDLNLPPMSKEELRAMMSPVATGGAARSFPLPPPHPRTPWVTPEYFREQMAKRGAMMRWVDPDYTATEAVAKLRELKMPILVLLGAKDMLMKPRQEQTYKKELPHARFVLVEGAEHDIQNTAPENFVSLVEQFMD
jgi:pimeloyl-ACP methyl ester carboxylesterase